MESPRPGLLHKPSGLVSDLVKDSKLETEFCDGSIRHFETIGAGRWRRREHQVWRRDGELGRGAYGSVWKESCVQGSRLNQCRALKVIVKDKSSARSEGFAYEKELEAIAKFSHKKYSHHFAESFGWFDDDTSVYISMEYFSHGDLQGHISAPFPEEEVKEIASQLLEGLQFMHDNNYVHRDLKPANVLVRELGPNWWVKIADFGITKRAEEGLTVLRTVVGTPGYVAPEVVGYFTRDDSQLIGSEDLSYTSAVDIWALGALCHRLITNQQAFNHPREVSGYVTMGKPFPTTPLEEINASIRCLSFIKATMARSPSIRPSASAALDHAWLRRPDATSPGQDSVASDSPSLMATARWTTMAASQIQHESNSTRALVNNTQQPQSPTQIEPAMASIVLQPPIPDPPSPSPSHLRTASRSSNHLSVTEEREAWASTKDSASPVPSGQTTAPSRVTRIELRPLSSTSTVANIRADESSSAAVTPINDFGPSSRSGIDSSAPESTPAKIMRLSKSTDQVEDDDTWDDISNSPIASDDCAAGSEIPADSPNPNSTDLDALPTIHFNRFSPPSGTRPSLDFEPISRTLPRGSEVIKVGRYSESKDPGYMPAGVPSTAPVGFKSKVVSRKHCQFSHRAGKWYLEDVGSSSGTFLNGHRLAPPGEMSTKFRVRDGDHVQLGVDYTRGEDEMMFRRVAIEIRLDGEDYEDQDSESSSNHSLRAGQRSPISVPRRRGGKFSAFVNKLRG